MSEPRRERLLAELPSLLGLEKIEENLFVGRSRDLGFGALFGGQVLSLRRIFDQRGRLAAFVAQEGLIRNRAAWGRTESQ